MYNIEMHNIVCAPEFLFFCAGLLISETQVKCSHNFLLQNFLQNNV